MFTAKLPCTLHCTALHTAQCTPRILEAGLDSPVSSGRRNRLSGEALLRCGPFHRSFVHPSPTLLSRSPSCHYRAFSMQLSSLVCLTLTLVSVVHRLICKP